MKYTITDTMRFCDDIGMFAIDRSIPESCVHQTEFCKRECFNDKLYKLYPAMETKDVKNEIAWKAISKQSAIEFRNKLKRARRQTNRVRLMTRGEAFSDYADVERVRILLVHNPDSVFWIPTRAWRNPVIWSMVQSTIAPLPNARIHCSLDPTNDADETSWIDTMGYSTMYFGDDTETDSRFKCPKTWQTRKGSRKREYCSSCIKGCFADFKVDVHLKKH